MLVYKENEHTPVHHTTVRNSNDTRTPVSVVRNKFPPSCTCQHMRVPVTVGSLAHEDAMQLFWPPFDVEHVVF